MTRGSPRLCDHDKVLESWCLHPGITAPQLDREHRVSLSAISTVIRRARLRGDARAIHKPKANRAGGSWTAFFVRLRAEGASIEGMAGLSPFLPGEVRKLLKQFDRRTA